MIKVSKNLKSSLLSPNLLAVLGVGMLFVPISKIIVWGSGYQNLIRNLVMLFLAMPLGIYFIRVKEKTKFLIYLIVFLLPVATYVMPPGRFGFDLFEFLLLVLVVMWLPGKLMRREKIFHRTPLTKPLTLLFAAALLSSALAHDPGISFLALLLYLKYYLFYVIAIDVIDDLQDFKIIVVCLAIGVFLSAVMGIYQSYFGLNLIIYKTLNPNVVFTFGRETFWRVIGPFSNSLNFANYLSVGVFFLFYFLVKNKNKLVIMFTFLLISVITFSLFATVSRMAILSALICFSLSLFLLVKRSVVSFIVAAIVLAFALMPSLSDLFVEKALPRAFSLRMSLIESIGSIGRVIYWKSSIPAFFAKPLTGSGLLNCDYAVGAVSSLARAKGITTGPFILHFEGTYLAILLNMGVIALIGFVWLILVCLKDNFIGYRESVSLAKRALAGSLFLGMASLAINISTNPAIIIDSRVALLFWLLLALTGANVRLPDRWEKNEHNATVRREPIENVASTNWPLEG